MLTKTFRAETMLAAFQAIQQDLGTEAIVVSVRKMPGGSAWQVWKKPYVEVVAMGNPGSSVETRKNTTPEPAEISDKQPEGLLIRRVSPTAELAAESKRVKATTDVKTQPLGPRSELPAASSHRSNPGWFSELTTAPAREAPLRSQPALPDSFPPLARLRMQLINQGIDEKLVQRVIKTCAETLSPVVLQDEDRIRVNLQRQLEAELRIQTPSTTLANRIMCLVGTSGSGKTSTCAKLAAFFSKTLEKKVVWICADTVRTGAIAEARTYTEALNIPLYLAYTPEDLVQAIESESGTDLILVDLPGCNPRNENKIVELGAFLTAINKRNTYIVAPSTTKEADLMDMLAAFSPFNLKGLIFTKMDETRVYGNLFNLAWRSQLPLAFFSNGTRIMDDLYPGQEKDLVSAMFREGFGR